MPISLTFCPILPCHSSHLSFLIIVPNRNNLTQLFLLHLSSLDPLRCAHLPQGQIHLFSTFKYQLFSTPVSASRFPSFTRAIKQHHHPSTTHLFFPTPFWSSSGSARFRYAQSIGETNFASSGSSKLPKISIHWRPRYPWVHHVSPDSPIKPERAHCVLDRHRTLLSACSYHSQRQHSCLPHSR